jgi:ferric hydroxamate transport system substrate-binding protein
MRKIITALLSIMTLAFLITANGVSVTLAQLPSSMNNSSTATVPTTRTNATNTTNTTETAVENPLLQSSSSNSSTNNQTRVINHTMGQTELTGTPQKIATLDLPITEHLLILGVQPVGAIVWEAHGTGLRQLMQEFNLPLSPDVLNVGQDNGEPNLEVIAQLQPDLIIASIDQEMIYEDLNKIAPTILLDYTPKMNGTETYDEMEQDFMTVADAINRHEQGVAVGQIPRQVGFCGGEDRGSRTERRKVLAGIADLG